MAYTLRDIILLVLPASAICAPVAPAFLDRTVRDAKLVVVAQVAQGSQSGVVASVTLTVLRTLKGLPPAGAVNASITTSYEFTTTRTLNGRRGIWFLAEDAKGNYTILPTTLGSLPLEACILPALPSLPSSWAYPESATPVEKVLRELAAALENNTAPGSALEAAWLSQKTEEPASSMQNLYRRMQASPSAVVSQSGFAGLIKDGDAQALETLAAQRQSAAIGPFLLEAVYEYFNGNPRGLSVLAQLAGPASPIPRLRSAAAFALRNIHSKESLPYLAALLDSDDPDIRYQGMAGLASFANTGFVPRERPLLVDGVVQARTARSLRTPETSANFPTGDVFRRDEARYVSYWKQWIRDNADALR